MIGRYFLRLGIFIYNYYLLEQWRSAQLVWLSNAWGVFIMNWRKQRIMKKQRLNNEIGKNWKFLWKYTQVLVTNWKWGLREKGECRGSCNYLFGTWRMWTHLYHLDSLREHFQGEKYRLSLSFKEFCLTYVLRYTASCFRIWVCMHACVCICVYLSTCLDVFTHNGY